MNDDEVNTEEQAKNEDDETFDISRPLTVKVRMVDSPPTGIQFVNHMTSQFTAEEFILTFAQIVPPSGAELTPEEFMAITRVDARVVCRVGLSVDRMRQLIEILNENYSKYLARFETEGDQ